jgi:hypothetical protein
MYSLVSVPSFELEEREAVRTKGKAVLTVTSCGAHGPGPVHGLVPGLVSRRETYGILQPYRM